MAAEDSDLDAAEEVPGTLVALESAELTGGLPAEHAVELEDLERAMVQFAAASRAENTLRPYSSDWSQFEAWCARYELAVLPAEPRTAALFLTAMARRGLKLSTIRRRAAAISRAHRQAGHTSPIWDPRVITVLEGIARTLRAAPRRKVALIRDPLLDTIDGIDTSTTAGLRDRALLLVGFALGLRRAELVALDLQDLSPAPDGMRVRIARSKTDQTGEGRELLLTYAEPPNPCPVRALRAWLDAAGIVTGPVFRRVTRTGAVSSPLSAQSVALIVKRRVKAAGLDAAAFAGHSLRSGFATQAARDGYRPAEIADVTRHRDQRVLDGYIQAGKGAEHVARVL
jgi:site-specific recombinase XerD